MRMKKNNGGMEFKPVPRPSTIFLTLIRGSFRLLLAQYHITGKRSLCASNRYTARKSNCRRRIPRTIILLSRTRSFLHGLSYTTPPSYTTPTFLRNPHLLTRPQPSYTTPTFLRDPNLLTRPHLHTAQKLEPRSAAFLERAAVAVSVAEFRSTPTRRSPSRR